MPYKNPDDRRKQQRRWIAEKRARLKAEKQEQKEGENNV
jgi:hypothetical protein